MSRILLKIHVGQSLLFDFTGICYPKILVEMAVEGIVSYL